MRLPIVFLVAVLTLLSSTNNAEMLTLHHLKNSQSFRIVWLLEELGLSYDIKIYDRVNHHAPDEYKKISPLGTSPVVTDNETGLVLSESNAIIDHILDMAQETPGSMSLRPSVKSPQRVKYLFWFHSIQGSMQPLMVVDSLFQIIPKQAPRPVSTFMWYAGKKVREAFIEPRLSKLMQLAEEDLAFNEFLAGPTLSAADITAIYSMDSVFANFQGYAAKYPKCKAWLDRMYARQSFQLALTKIGEERVSHLI